MQAECGVAPFPLAAGGCLHLATLVRLKETRVLRREGKGEKNGAKEWTKVLQSISIKRARMG